MGIIFCSWFQLKVARDVDNGIVLFQDRFKGLLRKCLIQVDHSGKYTVLIGLVTANNPFQLSRNKGERFKIAHRPAEAQASNFPAPGGAVFDRQSYETRLRRIRQARWAAPKPLSMLTTVSPAAHELSMASSAARPLRLVP